jgi:hypothetical protein
MKMSKSMDEVVVPAIEQRTLPVYAASGTDLAMVFNARRRSCSCSQSLLYDSPMRAVQSAWIMRPFIEPC